MQEVQLAQLRVVTYCTYYVEVKDCAVAIVTLGFASCSKLGKSEIFLLSQGTGTSWRIYEYVPVYNMKVLPYSGVSRLPSTYLLRYVFFVHLPVLTIICHVVSLKSDKPRKKKRKERDANGPKRPPTAYILWFNDTRDQIKSDNPGISFTDIAKKGGELWKKMSSKEKEVRTVP